VDALPDELLMAYADGALDKETRARIEALLHQDSRARRRVAIYSVTGAPLSEIFDPVMEEAVPERLMNFVYDFGTPKPGPGKSWTRKLSAAKGWLTPQPGAASWQLAAALVLALAAGSSAGWVLHDELAPGRDQQELAALSQGEIIARGSLARILETAPGNREARLGGWLQESTIVRVNLTFKNKSGGYCREYEMAVPASGNFAGLACRTAAGQWAVQVHVGYGAKPLGSAIIPAGRARVLDPVIDRMIDGDALGKPEEETVIARHWH